MLLFLQHYVGAKVLLKILQPCPAVLSDLILKWTAEILNQCLEGVMGWMRANKMRLCPDKMVVLLAGSNSILGIIYWILFFTDKIQTLSAAEVE